MKKILIFIALIFACSLVVVGSINVTNVNAQSINNSVCETLIIDNVVITEKSCSRDLLNSCNDNQKPEKDKYGNEVEESSGCSCGTADKKDVPSVISVIGISLIIMVGSFLFMIPKSLCCGDSDGSILALGVLAQLIYTIYVFINWGFGRGIVATIFLIIYGAFMSFIMDRFG